MNEQKIKRWIGLTKEIIEWLENRRTEQKPVEESKQPGQLLRNFVEPSDSKAFTTFSVQMKSYLKYLGTDRRCMFLLEPQLKVVCFAAELVTARHLRPVKILEASGMPGYQSLNHPLGSHRDGKDMDDRYQLLNGKWHWELHWDFWSLLKCFIPGIRVRIGKAVEYILLVNLARAKLPTWLSVDTSNAMNHDFDPEDCRSERGVGHAHISGLDTPVNWDAELPDW